MKYVQYFCLRDIIMRKKIGIGCWWLGTGLAFFSFVVTFYWLLSSADNATEQAILSLALTPVSSASFWAISYLLAGPFWNDSVA
jgi:hypothetical protein